MKRRMLIVGVTKDSVRDIRSREVAQEIAHLARDCGTVHYLFNSFQDECLEDIVADELRADYVDRYEAGFCVSDRYAERVTSCIENGGELLVVGCNTSGLLTQAIKALMHSGRNIRIVVDNSLVFG